MATGLDEAGPCDTYSVALDREEAAANLMEDAQIPFHLVTFDGSSGRVQQTRFEHSSTLIRSARRWPAQHLLATAKDGA